MLDSTISLARRRYSQLDTNFDRRYRRQPQLVDQTPSFSPSAVTQVRQMATPEAHDLGVKLQRALGVLDSIHGLLKDEVFGGGIWLMHTLHCSKSSSCQRVVAGRQAGSPTTAGCPAKHIHPWLMQAMAA